MTSNLDGFLVIERIDSGVRICVLDLPAGRRVRVVTPNCEGCFEPSLSAGGEKIAFCRRSSDGADIWQVGTDGRALQPLIQGVGSARDPAWSPDGSLIAYRVLEDPYTLETPDGPRKFYRYSSLHIARADGTGEVGLTRRDGEVFVFDWAPSGEQLVVSARLEDVNRDGVIGDGDRTRLYIVDLLTRDVWPVFDDVDSSVSMHEPSWSPNGVHIAFIEGHGGPASYGDLVVMKVDDGSEVARLNIGPGATYSWSPNGHKIAYVEFRVTGRVGYDDLFIFDLATGDTTRITDTSLYSVFSADELNGIQLDHIVWSPDGSYLAFIWRTEGKDYIVVASADGSQLSRIVGLGPGYHRLTAWGP